MIASITGRLKRKAPDHLIVDVSGIGYQVYVPLSTFCNIPELGEEISLHIHTHLREESLSLFGFLTDSEKEIFLLLMSVSGIGPKLALAVLSGLSVEDICAALQGSDNSKLCTISGIGKKTAARMVLELKDRIVQMPSFVDSPISAPLTDDDEDVISALINLGYKRLQAEEAVKKVSSKQPRISLQELIKEALGMLMKR